MQYILTDEEYSNLVLKQAEPTSLVQMENKNLKTALDIALHKIHELEAVVDQLSSGMMSIPNSVEVNETPPIVVEDHYARWTTIQDTKLISLAQHGASIEEAMAALNRTRDAIKTRCSKIGISTRNDVLKRKGNKNGK